MVSRKKRSERAQRYRKPSARGDEEMKELTRSIDTDLDEERPSRLSIGGRVAGTVGLIMACVTLGGCDQLLEVDLPGEVEGEDLEGPGSIELLVTSAVGAFECAFTNYMVLSANTSDELTVAGSFSNFFPYDQRDIQPNEPVNYAESTCDDEGALFTPVNQARAIADDAIRRLMEFSEEQVPNKDELLARAAAYSGFTKVIMGEGFCRSAFDGGPELSREEVMDSAVAAFTLGIDAAERAGADDLRILSYLGRARARIYLGDKSAAAADAREVPEGFEMFVTRSATAVERENKMYRLNLQEGRTSVEPPFRTAGERPFQTITWKGVEGGKTRCTDSTFRKGGPRWNRHSEPPGSVRSRRSRGREWRIPGSASRMRVGPETMRSLPSSSRRNTKGSRTRSRSQDMKRHS